MQKLLVGRPLLPEILGQTDALEQKSPIFLSIFACSISAVTSSEKVQLSLIGSPTHFPMSPRWISYAVPNPKGWLRNAKCSK